MSTPNLGFIFYKDYYRDENNNERIDDSKIINDNNAKITNQKLSEDLTKLNNLCSLDKAINKKMYFKTTYPGLLIGSGYAHGIKDNEEFKIGFYFDHTTGLPEIPASTIKGLLRSPFKDKHYDYIVYIIEEVLNMDIDEQFAKDLEREIFDGKRMDKDGKYENIPVSKRDIFFNGIIDYEKTKKSLGDKSFLGEDYITPHEDGLCEPKPIKFLKVLPNVVFCLSFNLKNSTLLTVEQKIKLFNRIILDLGIGAKTNVGYGSFDHSFKSEV